MKNLLQQASDWLEAKRTQFAARMVAYWHGNQVQNLPATVDKTIFEVDEGFGIGVRFESRDFLILAADLIFDNQKILPQKGDRIYEMQGDTNYIYEVMAPGKEPCWRFSDPYRKTLRIHAQQVAVLCYRNILGFNALSFRAQALKVWAG